MTTESFHQPTTAVVKTIELNEERAAAARKRLSRWPNVEVVTGDSAIALEQLATTAHFPKANVFFYLSSP